MELAAAATKAKQPLLLGFMKRFSSGNKIGRNVLQHEDFGKPLSFVGSYMTAPTYFEGEADYRGFFLHHCIHYLDLAPWLMGSPIEDIDAREVEAGPGKLLIHLGLGFESGAVGTLVMGTMQSRGAPVEFIQIMGDHRKIEIRNVTECQLHARPRHSRLPTRTPGSMTPMDTLSWTPNMTVAANEDHKGYRALWRPASMPCADDPSSAPTIDDAVRAMTNLGSHGNGA